MASKGKQMSKGLSKVFVKPKMFRSPTPFIEDFDKMLDKDQISVVGSLIYEEPATGDHSLSFYSAKFKNEAEQPRFPQQPLRQSWIVNYPYLAYKSTSPDNRDIVLVHLAQDIPQRTIHLGHWEFVSFVNGSLNRDDISQQILFLVKHARTG